MFDSSGHLNAGYLAGNMFQLGYATMCLEITEDEPYLKEEDKKLPPLRYFFGNFNMKIWFETQ